ncbi:MAG: indolepyruvate ferredoxin oxidoreductase subunit alpha [Nitrososphaerales archaeon]|nr:indolepyruvate ferredoxin oxidoreductase subunit alpha [Nitrososphaerales archaeon]
MSKKSHDRHLLSGNEAIARGAIEAGIRVATAYPGTPSSEIADSISEIAREAGIYMEYSTNEIVAVEVAAGASLCGVRALSCMKHVGLNVASDALITLAYTGVRGGLVVVSADDPGCWSSQSEQDNRYYAPLANLPCLEPSNSQEAKDWTVYTFELSEKFELPVLFRTTTRVSHTLAPVKFGSIRKRQEQGEFIADVRRFVMVPDFARVRHSVLVKKINSIKEVSEKSPLNMIVREEGRIGFVTSGVSFNYTMEAIDALGLEASVLKLGIIHPFPENLVKEFVGRFDDIFIVEELEPYLENAVKASASSLGSCIRVHGKSSGFLPRYGELSTTIVTEALAKSLEKPVPRNFAITIPFDEIQGSLPPRPPILCAGCPHRATFYAMRKSMKGEVVNCTDIGCYALGIQAPLKIGDLLICMGASVGAACGMSKVQERPTVAIVGDSTFFHAAIPGLIDAVYNNHRVIIVVLDNYATAMTGFQPHPGTGITGMGIAGRRVVIEEVAMGCGVEHIKVVNPYDVKQTVDAFRRARDYPGPSVIVSRQKCSLLATQEKRRRGEKTIPYKIVEESCDQCLACIKVLGCPAIAILDQKVVIDANLCTGCSVCAQVCPNNAIEVS